MRKNKYQGYRAIDFLKDEDFLRWNFFKEENDNTYWKNVMEMSPELTPSIEKAILLYNTQVRLNDYSLAPEVIESHYTIFYQHVQQHRKRRSLYIWFSAVASLLLLFAITLIYQHSKEQPSELLEFVKATSFSKDTISKEFLPKLGAFFLVEQYLTSVYMLPHQA